VPCPVRLRLGALDVGGNYSAQRAQTERSPLTACFQNCTHRRAHVSHQPRGQGGPPPGAGARGQGEPLPCYAAATTRSRSARPHEVGSAGRRHQGMRGERQGPRAKGQGPGARGQWAERRHQAGIPGLALTSRRHPFTSTATEGVARALATRVMVMVRFWFTVGLG